MRQNLLFKMCALFIIFVQCASLMSCGAQSQENVGVPAPGVNVSIIKANKAKSLKDYRTEKKHGRIDINKFNEHISNSIFLQVAGFTQDKPSVVSKDGTYDYSVSANGTQVLFLVDSNNTLLGLTLSLVDPVTNEINILDINDESTAVALLYIFPFYKKSSDPLKNVQYIKSINTFPNLLGYITNNRSKGLNTLLQDNSFIEIMNACTNELSSGINANLEMRGVNSVVNNLDATKFFVTVKDIIRSPDNIGVRLHNYGWRFVNVFRQDLDRNDQEISSDVIYDGLSSMGGAIPASIGSLITATAGSPTVEDYEYSVSPYAVKTKIWIAGPGAQAGESLPASFNNNDYYDALAISTIYYIVFPLIDVLYGFGDSANFTIKTALQLYGIMKGSFDFYSFTVNIIDALNKGDFPALISEIVDMAFPFLEFTATHGLLSSAGIISTATEKYILNRLNSPYVLAVFAGFLLANYYWMVNEWTKYPVVAYAVIIYSFNQAPSISSVSASPASVSAGGNSSLTCNASDPDGDTLTYSWTKTGGTISGTGRAVTWTAPSTTGSYTATCSVSDGRGGSASGNATITVGGNRNPSVSSVTASPSSVSAGGSSSLTCNASDPDGDALTYSWTKTGGTISGTGRAVTWTAPSTTGTYTVTCSVSDGRGGSASGNTTIMVTGTSTYSISGTVATSSGAGVSGVGITLRTSTNVQVGTTTTLSTGTYTFNPVNSGGYIVIPQKTGCTFSPPSNSFNLSANKTGVNFTASCQ